MQQQLLFKFEKWEIDYPNDDPPLTGAPTIVSVTDITPFVDRFNYDFSRNTLAARLDLFLRRGVKIRIMDMIVMYYWTGTSWQLVNHFFAVSPSETIEVSDEVYQLTCIDPLYLLTHPNNYLPQLLPQDELIEPVNADEGKYKVFYSYNDPDKSYVEFFDSPIAGISGVSAQQARMNRFFNFFADSIGKAYLSSDTNNTVSAGDIEVDLSQGYIAILAGEGFIRIHKSWWQSNGGSKPYLKIQYKRFANYRDTVTAPVAEVNINGNGNVFRLNTTAGNLATIDNVNRLVGKKVVIISGKLRGRIFKVVEVINPSTWVLRVESTPSVYQLGLSVGDEVQIYDIGAPHQKLLELLWLKSFHNYDATRPLAIGEVTPVIVDAAPIRAWKQSGTTFTDITSIVRQPSLDNAPNTVSFAANDYLYVGSDFPFSYLRIRPLNSSQVSFTVEYFSVDASGNQAWRSVTGLVDGTNGLTKEGYLSWKFPSLLTTLARFCPASVNSSQILNWVRIRFNSACVIDFVAIGDIPAIEPVQLMDLQFPPSTNDYLDTIKQATPPNYILYSWEGKTHAKHIIQQSQPDWVWDYPERIVLSFGDEEIATDIEIQGAIVQEWAGEGELVNAATLVRGANILEMKPTRRVGGTPTNLIDNDRNTWVEYRYDEADTGVYWWLDLGKVVENIVEVRVEWVRTRGEHTRGEWLVADGLVGQTFVNQRKLFNHGEWHLNKKGLFVGHSGLQNWQSAWRFLGYKLNSVKGNAANIRFHHVAVLVPPSAEAMQRIYTVKLGTTPPYNTADFQKLRRRLRPRTLRVQLPRNTIQTEEQAHGLGLAILREVSRLWARISADGIWTPQAKPLTTVRINYPPYNQRTFLVEDMTFDSDGNLSLRLTDYLRGEEL